MHKVYIGRHKKFSKGVFAARDIKKGELLFRLNGKKYYSKLATLLPAYPRDHAVQVGRRTYICSTKTFPCNTNHSCSPNAGVRGMKSFYAIYNIKKGKEITFDYSTTENSDWHHKCRCRSKNCRRVIGPYRELPGKIKRKYIRMGIVSSYIIKRGKND